MKILMVCSGLFHRWDGLQRMAVFIANSMSIRGHSVLLLYCGGKKLSGKGAHAALAKDVATVEWNPFKEDIQRILPNIQEFSPDIAMPMIYTSGLWAYLALFENLDIPWVYTEHSAPLRLENEGYHLGREERLDAIGLANAVHVLLPEYLETIPLAQREKCTVIGNPIEIPENQARPDCAEANGKFRIITAGRLEANKNQVLLVKAFTQVASDFPDWELWLFGKDYGDKRKLQRLIRKENCKKKIFIRDFTYYLPQQFVKSHIFVLPSLAEGFPMVLLEAMALGLPSVALQNCPGPAALVVNGKTGLLAGDESPKALAGILVRLMQDSALRCRLGKAARIVMENCCPERIADSYEQMFLQTVQKYQGVNNLCRRHKLIGYYRLYHETVIFDRWLRFGKANKKEKLGLLPSLLRNLMPKFFQIYKR